MSLALLLICTAALLITAMAAAGGIFGTRVVYGSCMAVCVVALGLAIATLVSGATLTTHLPVGLPVLGANFRLDPLAAFFLIVVNLGAAAASLFGYGHGRHEPFPMRVLPFFPAFLAGMNLVVLADDAFTFLLSWELMSLMSWALVICHDREPENLRAGYIYIVMAGFGALALLLAFGILAGNDGNYAFAAMRSHGLEPQQLAIVLLLVLAGAGSKAGVVPLHVWLPLAHPAAPSHVSALMSGVMTKVAVYAFIRIAFDIMGPIHWGLAALVIVIGGVTAVLGVAYALMQHDLKRLLAYHTVENIGIIFVGLGLALAFRADGMMGASALAVSAALFHVFNHSLFKSLLFFGSGAIHEASGERDMERLGGLIHRMPRTAVCFLIGAAAISALPPLNGFVSEWLTFQAILLSPNFPQWGLRFIGPAVGAMLALAAALAAACFVKAFGVSFLGRPRSPAAELAEETDPASQAAMYALAALCIAAGLAPGFFLSLLQPVSGMLTGATMPAEAAPWLHLLPTHLASYNPLIIALALAAALTVTLGFVRAFANRASRRGPAWDCGYPDSNPATQYTAASFAQPIRRVFGAALFAAREEVAMPAPGDVIPARITVSLRDPAWDLLFDPVVRAVQFVAENLNPLQYLSIRRYLTFVFTALVVLLGVLALWG